MRSAVMELLVDVEAQHLLEDFIPLELADQAAGVVLGGYMSRSPGIIYPTIWLMGS